MLTETTRGAIEPRVMLKSLDHSRVLELLFARITTSEAMFFI